jgi:hypothetical protein
MGTVPNIPIIHRPNVPRTTPLFDLLPNALTGITTAIGRRVAYQGRLEFMFLDEKTISNTYPYYTYKLDIPPHRKRYATLPQADAHWEEIALGLSETLATTTHYTGRVLARFLDENCENPKCEHGPVDFFMEFMVLSKIDGITYPPPLLAAGIQAQHRHGPDGTCTGPGYRSALDPIKKTTSRRKKKLNEK